MQYITSLTYFFMLMLVLITPFVMPLLLKRKGYVSNMLLGSFLSFMMCVLLVVGFAYFSDLETSLRLGYLGFNFDGWTDEEQLRKIAPEFRDEATKLYRSYMGIGWTFKAIIGVVWLIPYHLVASGFVYIVSKPKNIRIR
jgi:hypothetical protein